MFVVIALSNLDISWEERDAMMYGIVGKSDESSATYPEGQRENRWYRDTIQEARQLVRKLRKIDGVTAHLRER